jgi:RNA recognition motif-containing protein
MPNKEQFVNIYVGNLSFRTTSEDLAAAFRRFGEVTSAQVVMDRETGRSRGFGFVEMGDEDARRAIEQLDGSDIEGRRITVNEARPRSERPRSDRPRSDRPRRPGGDFRSNR